MMVFTYLDSPLGQLLAVGDGTHLTGLYLPVQHERADGGQAPRRTMMVPGMRRDERAFEAARTQLGEYFAGRRQVFDLPLAPVGTAFQQRVWAALRQIEYGHTESYGQVSARLGAPGASRAVGMANSRNPISIIVPCHRVIGANGTLTGYAGGLDNKRWLLAHEMSVASVAR